MNELVKFFYIKNGTKVGPVELSELLDNVEDRDSLIWFAGLEKWTEFKQIKELNVYLHLLPPKISNTNTEFKTKLPEINKGSKTNKRKYQYIISILVIVIPITFLLIRSYNITQEYKQVVNLSGDVDFDYNFYVEKYYRDLKFHAIYKVQPKNIIIKYSFLDQLDFSTHIHAICFGKGDDDKIEIYINYNSWKHFNKAQKYWLVYHELSHDVLNLNDLSNKSFNEGKLMHPEELDINYNMDMFIESFHDLFDSIEN